MKQTLKKIVYLSLFIFVYLLGSNCKGEKDNNEDKTEAIEEISSTTEVEAMVLKKDYFSKEFSANGKIFEK